MGSGAATRAATADARYRSVLLGLHFEGLGPCDRHHILEEPEVMCRNAGAEAHD